MKETMTLAEVITIATDPYIKVIHALARGDCWCEVAISNPMFTAHTDACKMAQALVGKPQPLVGR